METETVVKGSRDGWRGGRTRREEKETVRERVVGNIGRAMQSVLMYKVHLRASATSAQGGQNDGKRQPGSTVDGGTWRGEIHCDPSSARRGSCTRRTAHIFLRLHAKYPAPGPSLRCFLTYCLLCCGRRGCCKVFGFARNKWDLQEQIIGQLQA